MVGWRRVRGEGGEERRGEERRRRGEERGVGSRQFEDS